jgi:hypothetical protein
VSRRRRIQKIPTVQTPSQSFDGGDGLTPSLATQNRDMALGMTINATQDVNGNYTNTALTSMFDNQSVIATDVLVKYTRLQQPSYFMGISPIQGAGGDVLRTLAPAVVGTQ